MEENYKLEKEYKVPADLFSEAYLEFQKKYIYPKSRIYLAAFVLISFALLIFGVIAMNDASKSQKYLVYLAILMAYAFAFREWYNPRKKRRNLTESVRSLGEPVYKIGFADKYVDISTVSDDMSGLSDEDIKEAEEKDPLPEKTRLDIDERFQLLEYDRFFLILSGKEMLYILPKEGFSESELKTVRELKK
jgi:hypothetical protein